MAKETAPSSKSDQFEQQLFRLFPKGGGTIAYPLPDGNDIDLTFNFDERKVPDYTLPDPFELPGGEIITTTDVWVNQQRPKILNIFQDEVYGRVPDGHVDVEFETLSSSGNALGGLAVRKEIRVWFNCNEINSYMDILLYLPSCKEHQPVPLFLGLNFMGNHSIHSDPEITLSTRWMPDAPDSGIIHNQATKKSRGTRSQRWPVEMLLSHGTGLATIYSGDLDPDFDDGFQNGIHPLFFKSGQLKPAPNEWGALSAWAWGLQKAMDYLETDDQVDHHRVAVIGHSRLGKAALWAGAKDERFNLVVSNSSGCMGAALSRRKFGETIPAINTIFPHWFCENFKVFIDREDQLPVDQHMLIALIAPRPVYVASAQMDYWADPKGEFLALKAAEPLYRLFGVEGIDIDEIPDINSPTWNTLGYHIRPGIHDITEYDWEQYIQFAQNHWS